MMTDDIKTKLLLAFLQDVPFEGCCEKTLTKAAQKLNIPLHEQILMYPDGLDDVIAYSYHYFDQKMLETCQSDTLTDMKIRDKVSFCVWQRFEAMKPYKQALLQIHAHMTLPGNLLLKQQFIFQTASEIWYAIGDQSTDWNFYSKRMLLSLVYISTLLCWFQDKSENHQDTKAFLSRRIENVMMIPKAKGQIKEQFSRVPNFFSLLKQFRDV